jgi:hypothetical protein
MTVEVRQYMRPHGRIEMMLTDVPRAIERALAVAISAVPEEL